MKKQSFCVWFLLATVFISFTVFCGGSEAYANTTSVIDNLNNPPLNDNSTADANSEVNSEPTSAAFNIWTYVKLLLSLVFVLGLLLFVLKFINKKNITYQQSNMLQSLGGISVGPQKSVQIVKVGNRILVVGVGEDIQVLANIEDEQEIEKLLALYEDQYNLTVNKPYVAQLMGKFGKKKQVHKTAETEEQPFSELLGKRLSEIKKERSNELERWKDKENDKQ